MTEASHIPDAGTTPTKKRNNYFEYIQRQSKGPSAPGSKPIPQGSPGCLAGLTFVFTGEMASLSRDDGQDLVKRYGGRVTTAPSGKTDYMVVGEGAGEAKTSKAQALGIKTIDEDAFLELIRTRSTGNAATFEKPVAAPAKSSPVKQTSPRKTRKDERKPLSIKDDEMWTTKYAPKSPEDLVGNHAAFENLVSWLRSWAPGSAQHAALLAGPPGIGKTTMALLAAKQAGLDTIEMNASDVRNKASLHVCP